MAGCLKLPSIGFIASSITITLLLLHSCAGAGWPSLIMIISIGIILGIGVLIPSELAPMEDKSRLSVMCTAPEGTSFEVMDDYMLNLIGIVDTIPEKLNFLAITAPGFGSSASTNAGVMRIVLTDPSLTKKKPAGYCRRGRHDHQEV